MSIVYVYMLYSTNMDKINWVSLSCRCRFRSVFSGRYLYITHHAPRRTHFPQLYISKQTYKRPNMYYIYHHHIVDLLGHLAIYRLLIELPIKGTRINGYPHALLTHYIVVFSRHMQSHRIKSQPNVSFIKLIDSDSMLLRVIYNFKLDKFVYICTYIYMNMMKRSTVSKHCNNIEIYENM